MNLELDHFFILVNEPAIAAQKLIDIGMQEGLANTHPGQGTANRRFYSSNSMLEFLWVRDAAEANHGPGKQLNFPQRLSDSQASPFGVILTRVDNQSLQMPFPGWSYQPDYFPPPNAFHVGRNSENLHEPLCFYVPFVEPQKRKIKNEQFGSLDYIRISVKTDILSDELKLISKADRLIIQTGDRHLMEVFFISTENHQCIDLRPELPMIIHF